MPKHEAAEAERPALTIPQLLKLNLPVWIRLEEAQLIEGSRSVHTFSEWLRRWNADPANVTKVKRRHGKVEMRSLIAAIAEESAKHETPAMSAQRALAERQSRTSQIARLN